MRRADTASDAAVTPGRNDPCPCGSGQKFKHCCGQQRVAPPAPDDVNPHEIGTLVALVNHERLSEAEQKARALLVTRPGAGMLWKILSVALMRQGKDPFDALRRAAELMPHDAEAHRNLGGALHAEGRWAEALESLNRGLALRPDDADALVEAGNALRGLRRAREAIPLYERALALDPKRAEAHNNLGNAYLELARYMDAIQCYQRAFDMEPKNAQILCNLGSALRQLGSLDEALTVSKRAAALDPGMSAAHLNLGRVLAARGQRDEAVASFGRALELDPRSVDALNNLGDVLRERGQRREALALYAQAVEVEPTRAESHCNLGIALFELRRVDEAVASYERALALQPGYAPAHLNLGLARRQQRQPEAAEASCRAALAKSPDYVEALCFLGELRADRGQFSEAEELFRRAISIDPGFSFAYCCVATHRKMTDADAPWLQGALALLGRRLPLGHEIGLRYAIGKYYDDVKQYDNAFAQYRHAHEMTKRYGAKYDSAKLNERVDGIVRSFDAAFVRRRHERASASEVPVFIVGMPRSGTSLAEQILASHPAVFGAGEVTFWNEAYDTYRDAERAGPVDDELMAGFSRGYLERLTASAGAAERVVDKMPANFLYAGLIHAVFPRARIIHMRRHPFDTCLSIYFQNFFNIGPYANDLDNLAHYYSEYLRITNHWRAVLPAATLLEVPYEALIEEQEQWTRRMLAFVGLPWDPRCLDFHETNRVVITASKWQVRQRISKASVGRWHNYERFVGPLQGLLKLVPAS